MVYPVALNLVGKTCLIIGGGTVARRKVDGLLSAGAHVVVISPVLTSAMPYEQITHIADTYARHYLAQYKPLLVFAATDDAIVNRTVAQDAHELGLLVNTVDNSADDDFSNMTALHRDSLTIAVSTGSTPVLGQHLRDEIDTLLGGHYPLLARWLCDLRPQVFDLIPEQAQRREFWRHVLDSDVLSLLRDGDEAAAKTRLRALFEEASAINEAAS